VKSTYAVLRLMIEDFVNDRTSLLGRVRPVVGSHLVIVLYELILVFFLVVVRDLGCTSRREADLGLRWRLSTRGYGVLTLSLFLGRDVSTSAHVRIRLGVRVGRTIDWCRLVRG
jgi:hypothetical protein